MTVGQRVKEARKKAGLSQLQLAEAIGVKQPTISELERGESQSSSYLIQIAQECDVDPIWLQTGAIVLDESHKSGSHKAGSTDSVVAENKTAYVGFTATPIGAFDLWDSSTPLGQDEIEIPFYREVELSAGSGSSVVKENTGFKLRFAKSTLKRQGVSADHAACVVVSGNSMQPVLPDKATVGIDTANTKVKDGEMYAVDHDGLLRVKILYRLPGGGMRLRSYNKDEYPDEDIPASHSDKLKVLGKVFWYSVLI